MPSVTFSPKKIELTSEKSFYGIYNLNFLNKLQALDETQMTTSLIHVK